MQKLAMMFNEFDLIYLIIIIYYIIIIIRLINDYEFSND